MIRNIFKGAYPRTRPQKFLNLYIQFTDRHEKNNRKKQ